MSASFSIASILQQSCDERAFVTLYAEPPAAGHEYYCAGYIERVSSSHILMRLFDNDVEPYGFQAVPSANISKITLNDSHYAVFEQAIGRELVALNPLPIADMQDSSRPLLDHMLEWAMVSQSVVKLDLSMEQCAPDCMGIVLKIDDNIVEVQRIHEEYWRPDGVTQIMKSEICALKCLPNSNPYSRSTAPRFKTKIQEGA